MLGFMIKNIRLKCVVAFLVLFLTFVSVLGDSRLGAMEILRLAWGGDVMVLPQFILPFVMNIMLVQFLHADGLNMVLKGDAYLSTRYENRKWLFQDIMKNILVINFIYVFILLLAFCVACIVKTSSEMLDIQVLGEVAIRGYMACTILILVQAILLILIGESRTFIVMLVLVATLVVLSRLKVQIWNCCPFEMEGNEKYINFAINMGYMAIGYFVYKMTFMKKEPGRYVD